MVGFVQTCMLLFLLILTSSRSEAQVLKADYQFQGNLNSSVGGAPAMTNLGAGNTFASDIIDGYTRQTVRFPFNNGLAVSTAGSLIPNNNYTVVIQFRFDNVTDFRRVLDATNGLLDLCGAYIENGRYENESLSSTPVIQPNTYFQAVIVREPTGRVRAYRDGLLRVDIPNDSGCFQISNNILRFFQDDTEFNNEASAGNVSRIRLYDAAMTGAQVQALDRVANASGGGDQSILFWSSRDGNEEVYSMNADGSNNRRLTNNATGDNFPVWSSNGQQILFSSLRIGGVYDLYTMNPDGGNQTRLTTNVLHDYRGSYSPDGSKILFSRCDTVSPFFCDIWKMSANGTNEINLTNSPAEDDDNARWSPTGAQIVWHKGIGTARELYRMNQDGSNQVRLTNNSVFDENATFSPDGSKIAFASGLSGNNDIFLMNSDLTGLINVSNHPSIDRAPIWSADGSKILFGSFRDSNDQVSEIYSMNPNGSGQTRLTFNLHSDFAWNWKGGVGPCTPVTVPVGQNAVGDLTSISCEIDGLKTDLYSFIGTMGQQVAISMETTQFFSKIELLNPSGTVIQTVGGVNGVNNARIPASGYFPLPATGTYTIRAIGALGGIGSYNLSLFEAPVQACTYSISPGFVDVPAGGGSFLFDVLTQPGCPPVATPPVSGAIYTGLTYTGGRVQFNVSTNTGAFRSEMIPVAGTNFTINQAGAGPPGNDNFAGAALITGASGLHNDITSNSAATAEGGEPAHAGSAAAKSVWYSWTSPANGLYSFSTSGSNFDTVMAIYVCPASGACTFANMTQVGSNDDTTSFDVTSKVNFRADIGRVYKIAVDGKNGASGNVELSWRQYRRLFRLYLQTYNGTQSPIVPDTITASNGTNTEMPVTVSLGVYEFDLPADNTVYNVTITGPTGIIWDPNGFPLDTSFNELDELMQGAGSGSQNTVSNAQFQLPQSVFGFIRNITAPEVPELSVTMASSRGPNPRPSVPCTEVVSVTEPPGGFVRYRCTAQPNSLHDIIPRMPGKAFAIPVRSFEAPITGMVVATTSTAMIASNAQTYTLAGSVAGTGSGAQIDLRYTPVSGAPEVTLRTTTNSSGAYSFTNLPAGTFQLSARRMGLVFGAAQAITLPGAGGPVNITPQVVCEYTAGGLSTIPFAGGPAQFGISTNHPACEWLTATNAPWIVINSGATVGNGPVHYTLQSNPGIARAGIIMIGGQGIQIQQEGEIPPSGIEGDLTPRSGPDGVILTTDVTQMRRFATGLDSLSGAVNEGQRADCAPRATLGDGELTSTDIVQVRRYATGLDPVTNAGGPAIALSRPLAVLSSASDLESVLFRREVRAGTAAGRKGGTVTVPVEMTALGNESAASFTLEYDASMLANPTVVLADGAPAGSILTVNTNRKGRIGILFEAAGTLAASPIPQRILSVTFETAPEANGRTRLLITGSLAQKGISDVLANTLNAEYLEGYIVFGSGDEMTSAFGIPFNVQKPNTGIPAFGPRSDIYRPRTRSEMASLWR